MAPCETIARLGGAEECFVQVVQDLQKSTAALRADVLEDLGESFAARVSLAYKGIWARSVKSFARDKTLQTCFDHADLLFNSFAYNPHHDLASQLSYHFAPIGTFVDFIVEQAQGTYPLASVANQAGTAQGFIDYNPFVLQVEFLIQGKRWITARMIGL